MGYAMETIRTLARSRQPPSFRKDRGASRSVVGESPASRALAWFPSAQNARRAGVKILSLAGCPAARVLWAASSAASGLFAMASILPRAVNATYNTERGFTFTYHAMPPFSSQAITVCSKGVGELLQRLTEADLTQIPQHVTCGMQMMAPPRNWQSLSPQAPARLPCRALQLLPSPACDKVLG